MTGSDSVPRQRPRSDYVAAFYIIGVQLFQMISLVVWGVVIPNTIMVFAQGFSWDSLMFVLPVWSYPALPLACAYPAWSCFFRHEIRRAVVIASAPMIMTIPFMALAYGRWPSF